MNPLRLAVFASGRGSHLENLLNRPSPSYRIVLLASDKAGSRSVSIAKKAGIATCLWSKSRAYDPKRFEEQVQDALTKTRVDFIALAGFMRRLSGEFVAHWQGRILNVHPSLLPDFPGLNCHSRALEAGVKRHGCSVHLVDESLDGGPLLAQSSLEIRAGETEVELAARVLKLEHELYPRVLESWARHRVNSMRLH